MLTHLISLLAHASFVKDFSHNLNLMFAAFYVFENQVEPFSRYSIMKFSVIIQLLKKLLNCLT